MIPMTIGREFLFLLFRGLSHWQSSSVDVERLRIQKLDPKAAALDVKLTFIYFFRIIQLIEWIF